MKETAREKAETLLRRYQESGQRWSSTDYLMEILVLAVMDLSDAIREKGGDK